jgi:hypothetical protein
MQRAPALKVGPASNEVGVQGLDWDHFALRQPVFTLMKGTPDPRSSSVIPRTVDATCAARFATGAESPLLSIDTDRTVCPRKFLRLHRPAGTQGRSTVGRIHGARVPHPRERHLSSHRRPLGAFCGRRTPVGADLIGSAALHGFFYLGAPRWTRSTHPVPTRTEGCHRAQNRLIVKAFL